MNQCTSSMEFRKHAQRLILDLAQDRFMCNVCKSKFLFGFPKYVFLVLLLIIQKLQNKKLRMNKNIVACWHVNLYT